MDRQAILKKISAMLRLQESSGFAGEASAAASLIDKLCKQYGVTIDEVNTPQVLTEEFEVYKKLDESHFILFSAIARFYDALGMSQSNYQTGRKVTTLKCIGTEAQQIQVRLYYDFLKNCMIRECEIAMAGEKILAELKGNSYNAYGFRANYCKQYAAKVRDRLFEMKLNREDHPDKNHTAAVIARLKLRTHRMSQASGIAAQLGSNAGANASLHRQTTGSQTRALCGAR
jgi:hypothetical protein